MTEVFNIISNNIKENKQCINCIWSKNVNVNFIHCLHKKDFKDDKVINMAKSILMNKLYSCRYWQGD